MRNRKARGRLVRSCPWRKAGVPHWCEKVPDNFACGTKECWALGKKVFSINFDEFDRDMVSDLMKAHELAAVDMLLDDLLYEQSGGNRVCGFEEDYVFTRHQTRGFAGKCRLMYKEHAKD